MTGTSGLTVFDHTEPSWSTRYARTGRENGAATYSRELVAHQAPLWADAAGAVTVSTCPLLSSVPNLPGGDLAVQYLHTYPARDPAHQARAVTAALAGRYGRVEFVTAYRPLAHQLNHAGFPAAWVPMTIDVDQVTAAATGQAEAPEPAVRRAVYYGNLVGPKLRVFQKLRAQMHRCGWRVDHVHGRQAEVLPRLLGYRYGIGVGRSALEMMALGLNVMIAGAEFGGLVTTEHEWRAQHGVNFNGRVVTYDRSLAACVEAWDCSWSRTDLFDASVGVEAVRRWVAERPS